MKQLRGSLTDQRDWPMAVHFFKCLALVPAAAALFLPGVFSWWLAAAYLSAVLWLLAPFVTMFHDANHRPLFAPRHWWANRLLNWVVAPLFGSTPESYFVHHLAMHHPEENLAADLSGTMGYQRDSAKDFGRYWLRFFFCFFALARYLGERRRFKLRRALIAGEAAYWVVASAALAVDWRAAVTVLVGPLFLGRTMLIIGNWGEHAFIDPAHPENPYRASANLIGARVNERCFNVGYHIGHHLQPARHFSEMRGEFEANEAAYGREDAVVFRDLHYPDVWWLLMTGRLRQLSERLVALPGAPSRTAEERVAFLRHRLQRIEAGPTS